MRYVELFAGVGGFRLGIERAFNIRIGNETTRGQQVLRPHASAKGIGTPPLLCVFANEWDKYAAQTYNKNFGGTCERGDICGCNWHPKKGNGTPSTPKPSLQPAQESLQRQGGESHHISTGSPREVQHHGKCTKIDTRDITTVPTDDIPDHELLVGGFPCQAFSVAGKRAGFNDTRGTMFFEVARILKDKRPGHLVLENVKGLLSHDSGKTFQTILTILADLGYRVEWQVLNSKDFGVPQNRERVYIVGHFGGNCGRQVFPITGNNTENPEGRFNVAGINNPSRGYEVRRDGLASSLRATEMGSKNFIAERQSVRIERVKPDIEHGTRGKKSSFNIRRLTPKECERLQGFPDDWTAGVSDTQRYKQMGNAVTVNVVEAVMQRLADHL